MSTSLKQKEVIKVKQYVADKKGHKVAAILDIEELTRVGELLEDLYDLKAIENRKEEQSENYEAYSRRRKASLQCQ